MINKSEAAQLDTIRSNVRKINTRLTKINPLTEAALVDIRKLLGGITKVLNDVVKPKS